MSGVHGAEGVPALPVIEPAAEPVVEVDLGDPLRVGDPVAVPAEPPAELVEPVVAEPPAELPTVQDAMRSITGFDEVAIGVYFRKDLAEMAATMATRATLFVLKRREGMPDGEAFKFAMNLPLGKVDGMFRAEQPAGQHAAAGGDVDAALGVFDRPEA